MYLTCVEKVSLVRIVLWHADKEADVVHACDMWIGDKVFFEYADIFGNGHIRENPFKTQISTTLNQFQKRIAHWHMPHLSNADILLEQYVRELASEIVKSYLIRNTP